MEEELINFVVEALHSGMSHEEVTAELNKRGLDTDRAEYLVSAIEDKLGITREGDETDDEEVETEE